MKLLYPARFIPLEDKNSGYTVVFPDLPGCVTEGDSLAEAIEMAVDAASGWILDELEDEKTPPAATSIQEIRKEAENEIVNIIVLNISKYAEKHGKKAVRKNCTLPSWLNERAEKEGINFSAVLQEALIAKLNI